jgi:hypothetical protein
MGDPNSSWDCAGITFELIVADKLLQPYKYALYKVEITEERMPICVVACLAQSIKNSRNGLICSKVY